MNNKSDRELMESFAHPALEHSPDKCGICLYETIKSEIAKELLASQDYDLKKLSVLTQDRWKQTDLFKEVTSLKHSGHSLEEIKSIMSGKGWESI